MLKMSRQLKGIKGQASEKKGSSRFQGSKSQNRKPFRRQGGPSIKRHHQEKLLKRDVNLSRSEEWRSSLKARTK